MYFSGKALESLQAEISAIAGKYRRLLMSYGTRNYTEPRAREYATHGFLRRLQTLVRCIDNELPTNDELFEAMINLQAFIFNAFGCIDNLAWIWVKEKGLQHDGSPIPDTWIGLRENNTFVRQSFSIEFQEYLNGRNAWFKNLENFRHALAHRLPPYIPPYTIPNDKVAAYQQQEKDRMAALGRRDKAEYERLSSEQRAVAEFIPCMKHSFEEATTIYFHPQVLTDFLTIEDLAQKMLKELDS